MDSELLYQMGGVPTEISLGGGKTYFVDPTHGNDGNVGSNPKQGFASVGAANSLCRDGYNDVIALIGGATADLLTTTLALSNNFCHLIGVNSGLLGMGQRSRIVGQATHDVVQVATFSGSGCLVENIQFFNGSDADVDSGAVVVSGSRNHFRNCFFAGMGHTTPAARAGSFSLKVSGQENLFENCVIGLDTILRAAAAQPELWLASGAARNHFKDCIFLSYSETTTKVLVKCDNGIDRYQIFENCLYHNFSVNWANSLANAFYMTGVAATHNIIFKGKNTLVGVSGWGDVVTHLYSADSQPNAGFGVANNPTT